MPYLAGCLWLSVSPAVATKPLAGAAFSSENSMEGGPTSKLTQFHTGGWTEGFSSLLAACRRPPQFLATRASPHSSWLPFEQARERAREDERDRRQDLFVTSTWKGCLRRQSQRGPDRTQRERSVQRHACILGGEDSRGCLRNWVPYLLTTFSDLLPLISQQS